ncbi:MAG: GNAT family N-acetyltransferase [Thermoplasmata archaeon]|nr:GNAT family N-acetyltransferase [Thermoplasmata archaeon]
MNPHTPVPLDAKGRTLLGEALPESPYTLAARHFLRRDEGVASVVGRPESFSAALFVAPWAPTEPQVFGEDLEAIWSLLRATPGWDCVNLDSSLVHGLAERLERELGTSTKLLDDIYYVLEGPPAPLRNPLVRHLELRDLPLLERGPPVFQTSGFGSLRAQLTEGIVAGAVDGDRLVSRIVMGARSDRFADLGGETLAAWRGRGFATAAAGLVAEEVRARDLTPVWSTGGENVASQRVALKLGFREYGRQAYVIVPALQKSGGFVPPDA